MAKTNKVSESDVRFLLEVLDDVFTQMQSQCSYFYGEKEDAKILDRINKITKKLETPPTHDRRP